MQKRVYGRSWKAIFNNLLLLLPDVVYTIFSILVVIFFGYTSGIIQFIISNIGVNVEDVVDLFIDFLRQNIFKIIVSVIGFIIVTFFVGVGRDVIKYIMMKDVVENKKISIKKAWNEKKKFYLHVVWLKVKLFFIYAVVSLIFGILVSFLGMNNEGDYNIGMLSILLVLMFFAVLFLHIVFMFRYAIMFKKEYDSNKTIKESLNLFRNKFAKVMLVFLILLLTWMAGSVFSVFISNLPLFGAFFSVLAGLILSLWIDLYLFYSYEGKI